MSEWYNGDMNALEGLYASLRQRRRPEDVAQQVRELLRGRLDADQEALLETAARGSLKRQVFAYTSMSQEFLQPVGAQRQVGKAEELFADPPHLRPDECDDPERVEAFIRQIGPQVRKAFGRSDFKADRLNGEQRAAGGLDLSRRRYNKLFRVLTRLEIKVQTMARESRKRRLTQIGKSALATALSWEQFASDVDGACFIAYLTARANLRSEFTIGGQQRAFDEIAAMLLGRCGASANWAAIATVYPKVDVLAHLSDEEKGELLGRWLAVMEDAAGLLKRAWDGSDINRATMIVKKGNDSSTWNNTASAFNKARDHWIALVYALGMDGVLDALCPGKALRLMAADVVAWHRLAGNTLEPDTAVWSALPLPWEVLSGEQTCTRDMVVAACQQHSVDSEKSGWAAARPRTAVAAFRPTPELVHGVTVASPFLATLLKRAGYFSGKNTSSVAPKNTKN